MVELKNISTEERNKATTNIDNVSTTEMLTLINEEDRKVGYAVNKAIPSIAMVVDSLVEALNKGGRLIYVGAGTSGRIGIMDTVELLPTFSLPSSKAFCLMAGGKEAFTKAVEGIEDNSKQAIIDLNAVDINSSDVVIGLSASGRTPYVVSAIKYANLIGCLTSCVVTASDSEMEKLSKIPIVIDTGAEPITGSTRMKSGTAQKMVCNMISSATMIKLGKVYENLMIDVMPTNEKLINRAKSILCTISNCSIEEAEEALKKYKTVKKALFHLLTKEEDEEKIEKCLNLTNGHIRNAIKLYGEKYV